MGREPEVAEPQKTINENSFKIKGEPLYGGKGKISSDLTSKNGDNDRDVACSEERYITKQTKRAINRDQVKVTLSLENGRVYNNRDYRGHRASYKARTRLS